MRNIRIFLNHWELNSSSKSRIYLFNDWYEVIMSIMASTNNLIYRISLRRIKHEGIRWWRNPLGLWCFNASYDRKSWHVFSIWLRWSWFTLVQVMTCCLTAPRQYLHQCQWGTTSITRRQFHSRYPSHELLNFAWKLFIRNFKSLNGHWAPQTIIIRIFRGIHNAQLLNHDDVIKWKHFPRYWPFVRGIHRSPVNSPHKGQWCGALMFSLICAWINGLVNSREAGDWRCHRAHYDVIVMYLHQL